jgi:hypothetical protein
MSTKKVKRKKTTMRDLCLEDNPQMYSEREPQYEFSNGRKFTKPQKTNRAS